MSSMSRRSFVQAAAGLASVAAVGSLSACTGSSRTLALVGPGSPAVAAAERARRVSGHCHNIYHAETGMMTTLSYQAQE